MRKNTTIDFAILGVLRKSPLTGYKIRIIFRETAMAHYSDSPGTIYPALLRVKSMGLVKMISITKDNGKKNQCYSITAKGAKVLRQWLTKPLTYEEAIFKIDEVLLRFSLFNSTEKKSMEKILLSFAVHISKYIDELEKTSLDHLPINASLAFKFGIISYRSTLKWIYDSSKVLKIKQVYDR